jgi:hypothetical protein
MNWENAGEGKCRSFFGGRGDLMADVPFMK